MDQIKNIRFTNQSPRLMNRGHPEESGGGFGWLRQAAKTMLAAYAMTARRLKMNANIPVLPIAGGALARVFLALVALVTYWLKQFARARKNRRDARVLAG